MIRHRRWAAIWLCAVTLVVNVAHGDAFDPPAGYYSTATGSGPTLKSQLNTIIKTGHTSISYDALRSALQVTDADPNSPGRMLLVYDRVSLNVAAINPGGPIPGWDNGVSWNREHTWPVSRGLGSESMPDGSDLHHLRPSTQSVNSDRGEQNFGGAFGAQPFGEVIDHGSQVWYPGDADAGMVARHEFYMAVRYDGTDSGTVNLELGSGNVTNVPGDVDPPPQLGDLNRLIEWHFAAPPDSFERRRNQLIYESFQGNRNPFIDRPEFAWSVFVNNANDSRISIFGATVDPLGGSLRNVDLGRVFVGGTVPGAQGVTLNKAGSNGTYYEVTTSGAATSSLSGRFNAFRSSQIDSTSFNVGLATNTTTAGLRSGTVTIDNLDITSGGGSGRGANDANDFFNVSLAVLDHAAPSFTAENAVTSITHDFGDVPRGSDGVSFTFNVFNLVATPGFTADLDFDSVMSSGDAGVLTTNLAGAAGMLSLAAGAGQSFAAMLNTAAAGSFSATYTLMFSDEDLPGALNKTLMLTLVGDVLSRIAGDYNENGVVDAADYAMWRYAMGQSVTPFSGADGDGDGIVEDDDYLVWRAHFGTTAAGVGTSFAAVPEPRSAALLVVALFVGWMAPNSYRRHNCSRDL